MSERQRLGRLVSTGQSRPLSLKFDGIVDDEPVVEYHTGINADQFGAGAPGFRPVDDWFAQNYHPELQQQQDQADQADESPQELMARLGIRSRADLIAFLQEHG